MAVSRNSNVRKPVKPKRRIAVFGLTVIFSLACGIFVFLWFNNAQVRAHDKQVIEAQRDVQVAVANNINAVLGSDPDIAAVYDSSNQLMFRLMFSDGVVGANSLPENFISDLQVKILNEVVPAGINLDEWSKSHTVLGKLQYGSKDYTAGSLGYAAVEAYCTSAGVSLSDEAKLVVGAYLDTAYTAGDLVAYIASVSMFGQCTGVVDAALTLFNKDVNRLTPEQLDYLVYAFDNSEASLAGYADAVLGGDQTVLDISSDTGDKYWLIKKLVGQELVEVLGDISTGGNLEIKLGIDVSLQSLLQEAVDNGLKSSISLDTDNQTVVNGAVGVVNPRTGLVTALVSGRSINTAQREFYLNESSLLGNYIAAAEEFVKDPTLTYATLVPIEAVDGSVQYVQFGSLVANDQLGLFGVSPETQSTANLMDLLQFGTSLYYSSKPMFIQEIKSSDGNILYTVPVGNSVVGETPSVDVRALIANTTSGDSVRYVTEYETGIEYGVFSSEFIMCGVLGTNTSGYSLSSADRDACVTTVSDCAKIVVQSYPRTPQALDPNGVVTRKVAETQLYNAEIVSNIVDSWCADLQSVVINSVSARSEFETKYRNYTSYLYEYSGLVSDQLLSELKQQLDNIRVTRTDELLQYVA